MQPLTHRWKKAKLQWEMIKKDKSLQNKFKKPNDLTVITAHNYDSKSLFEENMDYLGIKDYIVLRGGASWQNSSKIDLLLGYLNYNKCNTPYLLFCDARDTIFSDDPAKVIPIFEKFGCDLLFNSTMSKKGYERMPIVLKWAKKVTRKGGRLLNAGVFIGRPEFMKEVFEAAFKCVDLFTVGEGPSKRSSDQSAFRYVQPLFHPRLDVDYANQLIYRN